MTSYHETKDAGIDYSQYPEDQYNPDTDPGFVEAGRAKYSDTSVLTGDDSATQQAIFDRLPISQSKRRELYDWIITEYAAEQEAEEATKRDRLKKKRKIQECPTHDMEQ